MLAQVGSFVLGVILLTLGADSFARGVGGLALRSGMSAFGVGLASTALGALVLPDSSFAVLQSGPLLARTTLAVIAPGTGLGESVLVHDGTRYVALPTEAGHADFAPTTDEQVELWRYLRTKYGEHVSVERILSGNGIGDLYGFTSNGAAPPTGEPGGDPNAAITDAALAAADPAAVRALDLFAQFLGAEAGNLALKVLSVGGLYVGGGIAPRLLEKLKDGTFMKAFTDKGRLSQLLINMPVRIILESRAAVLGAAAYAEARAAEITGASPRAASIHH